MDRWRDIKQANHEKNITIESGLWVHDCSLLDIINFFMSENPHIKMLRKKGKTYLK